MDTAINVFNQMAVRIVKEQEAIIGSLAWAEAAKVQGLTIVDQTNASVSISGDPRGVIDASLVDMKNYSADFLAM